MTDRSSASPADIDLLVQAGVNLDESGRILDGPEVVIAVARGARRLLLARHIPDSVAADLCSEFTSSASKLDPSVEPAELEEYQRVLESLHGSAEKHASPYYLIPPGTRFASDALIARSDEPVPEVVETGTPGNWEVGEWTELLEGRYGPWAMVLQGERVVSICHTPLQRTTSMAECGVWTDPQFRGRGYAAAATAAWAEVLEPTGRWLVYSTESTNVSSQRVASRLSLRPMGWMWSIKSERGRDAAHG